MDQSLEQRRIQPLLLPATIAFAAAAFALAPAPEIRAAIALCAAIIPLLWFCLLRPRLWITLFLLCAILLPPIPVSDTGANPHPALFWVVVGVYVGILRWRQLLRSTDTLCRAFLIFGAALAISLIFAAAYSGIDVALASAARLALFLIAPYLFWCELTVSRDALHADAFGSVRLLYAAGVAAALFACIDFYYHFPTPAGFSPQFVWLAEGVFRRAQGLFYDASTLGNFCVFFLVMIAVALFRRPHERPCPAWALVSGAAVLVAALIFSGSRASVAGLLVSLVVLAFLQGRTARKGLAVLSLGAVLAAFAVNLLFPSFAHNYWTRLVLSVQYLWSSPEGVLSGRVASWHAMTDFVIREPWNLLFGIGYKTLPWSDYLGRAVIGDNAYLTLLLETGLAGLLSFIGLNIQIMRAGIRTARAPLRQASFFGTWITCFWAGELVQMLSGDLMTYWRVLPLYFWVLAVAARSARDCSRSAAQ